MIESQLPPSAEYAVVAIEPTSEPVLVAMIVCGDGLGVPATVEKLSG